MGCAYSNPQIFRKSKIACPQIESNHNRIFDVINVDDRGNEIHHGQIEITDNDLMLHQKSKNSIVWPLRSLRRYGFDAELFSFECGRRCSTGPGIYAFKSLQAEQLFNLLQESLQHCSNPTSPNNHTNSPQLASGVVSLIPSSKTVFDLGPRVHSNHIYSASASSTTDNRSYVNLPLYVNTLAGKGLPLPLNSSSSMSSSATERSNANYAKLDDLVNHYVNINTTVQSNNHHSGPTLINKSSTKEEIALNTNNFSHTNEDEKSQTILTTSMTTTNSISPEKIELITPLESTEPVNYIVLDLDNTIINNGPTIVTTAPASPISKSPKGDLSFVPTPPSSPTSVKSIPNNVPQSYATIDFDKTIALSNSAASHRKI